MVQDEYELPDPAEIDAIFTRWGWPSGKGQEALEDCLQVLKERSGQTELNINLTVRADEDHVEYLFRSRDRDLMKMWKALIWRNRRLEIFETEWMAIHRQNY